MSRATKANLLDALKVNPEWASLPLFDRTARAETQTGFQDVATALLSEVRALRTAIAAAGARGQLALGRATASGAAGERARRTAREDAGKARRSSSENSARDSKRR